MTEILDLPENRHKIQLDVPSVAVWIEALEQILVSQGILSEGQLKKAAERLAATKVLPGGDG